MSDTARVGLFEPQISRFPNHYPWAKEIIEATTDGQWTVKIFDFTKDVNQYHVDLNDIERGVITRTLSAIGQIEIDVKRFWVLLGMNLPHPIMDDLGTTLGETEVRHNDAYVELLKVLGITEKFQQNLEQVPQIRRRVEYLKKHNERRFADDRKQYIYSIILFTLFIENVSLFSQFYTVLWFGRFRKVLKTTAEQVEYTRNEEALHALTGITIINTLKKEYPEYFDDELEAIIAKEVYDAVRAEDALIDWMLGDFSHQKLNAPLLKNFIRNRMNESLESIGYSKVFGVSEELNEEAYWFTEELKGLNFVDFFDTRVKDYSRNSQSFSADTLFPEDRYGASTEAVAPETFKTGKPE